MFHATLAYYAQAASRIWIPTLRTWSEPGLVDEARSAPGARPRGDPGPGGDTGYVPPR